jgi:hypothetical protein
VRQPQSSMGMATRRSSLSRLIFRSAQQAGRQCHSLLEERSLNVVTKRTARNLLFGPTPSKVPTTSPMESQHVTFCSVPRHQKFLRRAPWSRPRLHQRLLRRPRQRLHRRSHRPIRRRSHRPTHRPIHRPIVPIRVAVPRIPIVVRVAGISPLVASMARYAHWDRVKELLR